MASDENGYLRRRLEAIERTALKLNFGGVNNDLKILRERLDVESGEVLRLRKKVDSLQAEKLVMSEVRAWAYGERLYLVLFLPVISDVYRKFWYHKAGLIEFPTGTGTQTSGGKGLIRPASFSRAANQRGHSSG